MIMNDTLNMIPKHEMSEGYKSIRNLASIYDMDNNYSILKISGAQSIEFINYHLTGKLYYLQLFSSQTTTLLDSNQKIIDIIQVIRMDDYFLLLCNSYAKEQVLSNLTTNQYDINIEDISNKKSIMSVEGPFAWQILKDTVGSDILGLRIYSVMEIDIGLDVSKIICIRSGFSGEYAYRMIVDKQLKLDLISMIRKVAQIPFVNHVEMSLACQEVCIPVLGVNVFSGDCPIEVGLRYMIDFEKEDYKYYRELNNKVNNSKKSLIAFVVDETEELSDPDKLVGKEIVLNNSSCGRIRSLQFSPKLGKYFGYALVEKKYAFPGYNALKVENTVLRTVSSPLVITKSNSTIIE